MPNYDANISPSAATSAEEAAEVRYIPVKGVAAHYGVFLYFALLAYPSRNEWAKRKRFVHAARARLLKGAIREGLNRKVIRPDYRRIKNEKMLGLISNCLRRIVALRFNASSMSICVILDGVRLPFDTPQPNGKLGIEIKAPGTINDAVGALVEDAERQNIHRVSSRARANTKSRIWDTSLPVLHLAIALYQNVIALRPVLTPFEALEVLLHKSAWLLPTVEHAERLRYLLPSKILTYEAARSICVLPETESSGIYQP